MVVAGVRCVRGLLRRSAWCAPGRLTAVRSIWQQTREKPRYGKFRRGGPPGQISPVKNAVNGIHVPCSSSSLVPPDVRSAKQPSSADADHRGLATSLTANSSPRPEGPQAQRARRASRNGSEKLARAALRFARIPQKRQGCRRRSRPSNHNLPPALSTSPATNHAGPSLTPIPARVTPLAEVHKWQQQPKLQKHQPQPKPIPSYAG